ncbi:MAG TPA: DUF2281 domain-containing protein [Balneolaceae bacterium]|nr:DUF2281 domain-containing protein [Balneolaceae bacterium]
MENDLLENKVRALPKALQKKVSDYIDYLTEGEKTGSTSNSKLSFDWEGGLSDLKEAYTSVELQHKAAEWR